MSDREREEARRLYARSCARAVAAVTFTETTKGLRAQEAPLPSRDVTSFYVRPQGEERGEDVVNLLAPTEAPGNGSSALT